MCKGMKAMLCDGSDQLDFLNALFQCAKKNHRFIFRRVAEWKVVPRGARVIFFPDEGFQELMFFMKFIEMFNFVSVNLCRRHEEECSGICAFRQSQDNDVCPMNCHNNFWTGRMCFPDKVRDFYIEVSPRVANKSH